MDSSDSLHRFVFERLGIRGERVRLDHAWQEIQSCHTYPESVLPHLGSALAGVVMLSASLKYRGSLILQLQGAGPLQTVVAQSTHDRRIRGLARWEAVPPPLSLADAMGPGRLVLTLYNEGSEPYQGIVLLEGQDVAGAIENYFRQSEQLATRLWLTADAAGAAGLLLQELPTSGGLSIDWDRVIALANTVTPTELLELETEALCRRLFHEEELRLFPPEPVRFACACSRERIASTLRLLGREEVQAALGTGEALTVDCEFCARVYRFDAVDLEAILLGAVPLSDPGAQ
jgi:molecular chaperone Hsp33